MVVFIELRGDFHLQFLSTTTDFSTKTRGLAVSDNASNAYNVDDSYVDNFVNNYVTAIVYLLCKFNKLCMLFVNKKHYVM